MGSSSPTRDQTSAHCIGSTGSKPLDHQGNPSYLDYCHSAASSFISLLPLLAVFLIHRHTHQHSHTPFFKQEAQTITVRYKSNSFPSLLKGRPHPAYEPRCGSCLPHSRVCTTILWVHCHAAPLVLAPIHQTDHSAPTIGPLHLPFVWNSCPWVFYMSRFQIKLYRITEALLERLKI